jgi:glycosyltransferase involved in cell wall biosynthesis
MTPITIALTTFNRFQLLIESVTQVINDPRVGEIVICDDASTDGSFQKICQYYRNHSKVKISRNEKNVDCYRNKKIVVSLASNEWVILFDSDNILSPPYLDTLYAINWTDRVAYLPEFAMPHFDYTAFSGSTITHGNVAGWMKQKHFATALNTANYFFQRDEYLQVWDGSVDPHTADSIYQNYNWLRARNSLYIVPGLRYHHRIHDESHYKRNVHKTGKFAAEVEAKLKAMR